MTGLETPDALERYRVDATRRTRGAPPGEGKSWRTDIGAARSPVLIETFLAEAAEGTPYSICVAVHEDAARRPHA